MSYRVVETVNSFGSCVYKVQRKGLISWRDWGDSGPFNTPGEAVRVIRCLEKPESERVVQEL